MTTHVLMPLLMTEAQVAEVTGRAKHTLAVDRMNRRGLPFVKLTSGCIRYRADHVLAAIESNTVQPLPLALTG